MTQLRRWNDINIQKKKDLVSILHNVLLNLKWNVSWWEMHGGKGSSHVSTLITSHQLNITNFYSIWFPNNSTLKSQWFSKYMGRNTPELSPRKVWLFLKWYLQSTLLFVTWPSVDMSWNDMSWNIMAYYQGDIWLFKNLFFPSLRLKHLASHYSIVKFIT